MIIFVVRNSLKIVIQETSWLLPTISDSCTSTCGNLSVEIKFGTNYSLCIGCETSDCFIECIFFGSINFKNLSYIIPRLNSSWMLSLIQDCLIYKEVVFLKFGIKDWEMINWDYSSCRDCQIDLSWYICIIKIVLEWIINVWTRPTTKVGIRCRDSEELVTIVLRVVSSGCRTNTDIQILNEDLRPNVIWECTCVTECRIKIQSNGLSGSCICQRCNTNTIWVVDWNNLRSYIVHTSGVLVDGNWGVSKVIEDINILYSISCKSIKDYKIGSQEIISTTRTNTDRIKWSQRLKFKNLRWIGDWS